MSKTRGDEWCKVYIEFVRHHQMPPRTWRAMMSSDGGMHPMHPRGFGPGVIWHVLARSCGMAVLFWWLSRARISCRYHSDVNSTHMFDKNKFARRSHDGAGMILQELVPRKILARIVGFFLLGGHFSFDWCFTRWCMKDWQVCVFRQKVSCQKMPTGHQSGSKGSAVKDYFSVALKSKWVWQMSRWKLRKIVWKWWNRCVLKLEPMQIQ